MPYLTNLADIARKSGFPVVEVHGWKSRGHGEQPEVQGIVCHHTGGWADRNVVVEGRSDLKGPLSHFWLQHDGTIFVVAAGKCWHNAPSTSPYHTNSNSLGIEAENRGTGIWPDVQIRAYKNLCAVLATAFHVPASRIKGHKEVNDAKDDPKGINMDHFRSDVLTIMKGGSIVPLTNEDVIKIWRTDGAVDAPDGNPDNPEWQAGNALVDTNKRVRRLEEQNAQIIALLKGLQP